MVRETPSADTLELTPADVDRIPSIAAISASIAARVRAIDRTISIWAARVAHRHAI